MSMLARGIGRRGGRKAPRRVEPSVREVCLLGPPRSGLAGAPGSEVEWGGRAYRVAAADPGEGPPRYLHLAPIASNP